MRKRSVLVFSMATVCVSLLAVREAAAHCEIPCGIYGDRLRVDLLKEHFETVRTSMQAIRKLEAADSPNANQLTRWVVNKEDHANKIQEIVYQYFMNQRIVPADRSDRKAFDKYVTQITQLHQMLVAAMKCKQTTDETHVEELQALLKSFEKSYFEAAKHDHD
jgi:nickel superoxide dismutase